VTAVILSGVFCIAWFLTLFCLFPMTLGSPRDSETGAPLRPRIGFKFLIATAVAIVGTAIFYVCMVMGWIDI
jgi:predicted secreted protein